MAECWAQDPDARWAAAIKLAWFMTDSVALSICSSKQEKKRFGERHRPPPGASLRQEIIAAVMASAPDTRQCNTHAMRCTQASLQ
jgi:hypothetical protein